jgi:threonine/homoserine/homoserine lactone efflux protein
MTTALNPKALVFGLVLLPSPDRFAGNLALFAVSVVGAALLWAGLGALLSVRSTEKPRVLHRLRRLASVFLAVMSALLLMRGVGA